MGDVHPLGNPHYWLDPGNGRRVAKAIVDKLSAMAPADAAYFASRYADFDKRLAEAEKRWDAQMAPYKGLKIVTYHRSWPNFADRFGLDVIGYVEPRPGIPPSPGHTIDLIGEMKRQNVKILLVEPYFDLKTPEVDRARDGRQGARDAALGRRREGDHGLHQALRLRSRTAGGRDQGNGGEVACWTSTSCNSSRRRSWPA